MPGTETLEEDDSASLVYENGSGTLFLLWQSKKGVVHSSLNLVSFKDDAWSPVVEIWGSSFGWKSSPQLIVTRDVFKTLDDDGALHTWTRTIAHVIWGEDRQTGPATLYSPIVLVDGAASQLNPVYNLSDLALVADGGFYGSAQAAFETAPVIQEGRNAQSVVIGFRDPESARLVSLELEILPGELSHLADRLGHQIVDIGLTLFPSDPVSFAEKLGHQIIDIGHSLGLHPGLTTYAAETVIDEVLSASPSEDINALAERLGHQIIDIGARMTDRGIDRAIDKSGYQLVEIDEDGADTPLSGTTPPPDLIRVTTVDTQPVPDIGEMAGHVTLQLSPSGDDMIVAWPGDDRLFYRESGQDGWSDTFELRLGSHGIDSLDRAFELLRLRAEGH